MLLNHKLAVPAIMKTLLRYFAVRSDYPGFLPYAWICINSSAHTHTQKNEITVFHLLKFFSAFGFGGQKNLFLQKCGLPLTCLTF